MSLLRVETERVRAGPELRAGSTRVVGVTGEVQSRTGGVLGLEAGDRLLRLATRAVPEEPDDCRHQQQREREREVERKDRPEDRLQRDAEHDRAATDRNGQTGTRPELLGQVLREARLLGLALVRHDDPEDEVQGDADAAQGQCDGGDPEDVRVDAHLAAETAADARNLAVGAAATERLGVADGGGGGSTVEPGRRGLKIWRGRAGPLLLRLLLGGLVHTATVPPGPAPRYGVPP